MIPVRFSSSITHPKQPTDFHQILAVPTIEDRNPATAMTVIQSNHVGVKRKRHACDDGFRVPVIQESYFFDGTASLTAGRGNTSATYAGMQTSQGPTYTCPVLAEKKSRSTPDTHVRTRNERDHPSPSGPSAARMEYRAMASESHARIRGSSAQSSRSSLGGKDSKRIWDEQTKPTTIPLSRRFPSTSRSSITPSRSSPSASLLPAHLRPSAISDQDSLSAERYASSLRLLATWESIALKYADVDPEDDAEIDISTGRIVRGKEKIAELPDRVIGGMSEDEEAEELGKRRRLVKTANSKAQAIPAIDPAEQEIHPVESLSIDAEDSDPSDMDELDAWNDSELEIQVEALPPSYTSKARHQRPWTADDDVDLQDFLRAEERRRAMFGDEGSPEDLSDEEEIQSQVSRAMDKEEAMSRRTVHASVPYYPPAPSDYPPRSARRSKEAVVDLGSIGFFARPSRPSSRRDPTPRTNESSVVDDSDAEDELSGMFATPDRLEEKELSCQKVGPSPSPSLRTHEIQGIQAFGRSSPSSASSYLNRQSTDGFSSSGEGEIFLTHGTWDGERHVSKDEDICERELPHGTCPPLPRVTTTTDPVSFLDSPHSSSPSQDKNGAHSQSPLVRNPFTPSGKLRAQEDEARCSPKNLVEVVIEVPGSPPTGTTATLSPFKIPEVLIEQTHDNDDVSNLRRSSRQGTSGKSYALRHKRKKRICPRDQSPDIGYIQAEAVSDQTCSDQPVSTTRSLLPSPPPTLYEEFALRGHETPLRTRRGTIRSRQRKSRPRSPSVVEGTPSVVQGTPEPMLDEVSSEELAVGLQGSSEYGRDAFALEKPVQTVSRHSSELIPRAGDRRLLDIFQETECIDQEADPIEQMPSFTCLLQNVIAADSASTTSSATVDGLPDEIVLSQGPLVPRAEFSKDVCQTQQPHPADPEDDDDILLLGATFEECEDIIWPESKPDISLTSSAQDLPNEWSDTPGAMTFKTVKGEKQEMSTFTAPFRCSRIIDLTGDDICGDDEHDELDEW